MSDKERKKIIEALKAGESQNAIAKKLGRSQTTIYRIAKAEGISSVNSSPKKANEARVRYAREGRIRIIEAALGKAEEMLAALRKPLELQQLAMALAVLIDKRRQEDDEETNRRGSITELMQRLREGEASADSPDG